MDFPRSEVLRFRQVPGVGEEAGGVEQRCDPPSLMDFPRSEVHVLRFLHRRRKVALRMDGARALGMLAQ